MAKLNDGSCGEKILVDNGVQVMCPYDRTAWCGTGCAQFQIQPPYPIAGGVGAMSPARVVLWCCNRDIDIDEDEGSK